jgi:hypothetical protein
MNRLEKLSDEKVFDIARQVVADFPDDKLQVAIEQLEKGGHLVSVTSCATKIGATPKSWSQRASSHARRRRCSNFLRMLFTRTAAGRMSRRR